MGKFRLVPVTASSLATVAVFAGVPTDSLEEIAKSCQGRYYGPGVEIISYLDTSSDVYFIVGGRVQVTMFAPSGKVITFQDLGPGAMFGEIGAIDGKPRTAGIHTITDTFVAQMSGRVFNDLLWRFPSVGGPVLERLTELIRFLCGRVIDIQALPVVQRIHSELLRLAGAQVPDGKRVVLDPASTHLDITIRAGTHREAVIRELAALKKIGLVVRHGRFLIINDIDGLIATRAGTHREAVIRELAALRKIGLVARRGRFLIINDIDELTALVNSTTTDGWDIAMGKDSKPGGKLEIARNASFRLVPVTASSLATVEAFAGVPKDSLEEIAKSCQGRYYGPGVEIISYLDTSRDVYFIVGGRVQVTMFAPSGKVITFQDLGPGAMFGEIGAIDGKPRTAGIHTITDTFVAQMSDRDFNDLLWRFPSVGGPVLDRLTELIRFLCGRVVEFHALPVAQRIHSELLRLAGAQVPDGKRVVLDPAPTHLDIANRAGTHREAVTRELAALKKIGLVERRGRILIVNDIDELTALVNSEWDNC